MLLSSMGINGILETDPEIIANQLCIYDFALFKEMNVYDKI